MQEKKDISQVMTGFGRTGLNFGIEHWNVTPDKIVFAKGASAGYLKDRLKTLYSHKIVGEVRGRGFLWDIEFVKDQKTKEPISAKQGWNLADLISKTAFKNGLVLYPGEDAWTAI